MRAISFTGSPASFQTRYSSAYASFVPFALNRPPPRIASTVRGMGELDAQQKPKTQNIMKTNYRKNSIEGKIDSLLPQWPSYDVIALELTHDGEEWSVNTPFRIASEVDRETAIARLADRWHIFKANYAKRANVRDISDLSCEENECNFEVDCIPFADVRNGEE